MAITLDELLGKNTQQTEGTSYDRFPSYEEFHAQRTQPKEMTQDRYDFDVRNDASFTSYAPNYTQNGFGQYGNPERNNFVQDSYAQTYAEPYSPTDLYDFTRRDKDRLSDAELLEKLEHTDVSRRPIFDRAAEQTVQPAKLGFFQRKAQKAEAVQGEKKRARLNTKGKIILGAYFAVIALVAVLIIVNASKINAGKAVTPSSNLQNNIAIVQIDK
ncbi:MAG: hypothetical protein J5713_03285 [Clostridia bacterium]|nr:hypothetical protein [Clostridia bacterium]